VEVHRFRTVDTVFRTCEETMMSCNDTEPCQEVRTKLITGIKSQDDYSIVRAFLFV
jgi:hypothetical protein